MARIIDGAALAQNLTEKIAQKTAAFCACHEPPTLAVLSSETDPASRIYIRSKIQALEKAGMRGKIIVYPETVTKEELIAHIQSLNSDASVHGILVQMPLPKGIESSEILAALDPKKDVDGFTPENIGKLLLGTPAFIPCTPQGIIYLLHESGIAISGTHAVIVGRSSIVGKPLAALLTAADATVTLCHSRTRHIEDITRQADILISAVGKPAFITGSMIKKGAAVIDVGINRVPDASSPKGYRLTGDVIFDQALEQAGFLTPVPGGVGPLTVAMVLRNTLKAAQFYADYAP